MRVFPRVRSIIKFLFDKSDLKTIKEHGTERICIVPLFIDVFFCKIVYGIVAKEYFFFSFYNKSHFARRQYVGTRERDRFLRPKNSEEAKAILRSKYRTYEVFKEFFRREIVKISLPKDVSLLNRFGDNHNSFIIKPISSTQGKGIIVVNSEMPPFSPSSLPSGEYVVEEFIKQDRTMASFHPYSVNTIRFVTYYNEGKLNKVFALIRMGVNGNHVDNTCAGGISAAIDLDHGVIISEAASQNGNRYYFHPDTEAQIIGAHIPQWENLIELVEEVAKKDPSMRVVGWDFALSEKGWCLVEGNSLPSFWGIQIALGRGCRSLLRALHD